MPNFRPAYPHGEIVELFPDVFQVTGSMKSKPDFHYSRNMTILRHEGVLTIVNSVRLNEGGLSDLEALGTVAHVIKLGGSHGVDDPFYVQRFQANYYLLKGDSAPEGIGAFSTLSEDRSLPIPGASLFLFKTTSIPEGILRLDREGGILLSCDSLQNWEAPDEYFNGFTRIVMRLGGFFKAVNIGPSWRKNRKPQSEDFERLQKLNYEHVLPGHGSPVLGGAKARFAPAIKEYFAVA